MTGFDFAFALFSLVLGLAVTEVLGGFAGVVKLHARARAGLGQDIRVGWLVPLLATLVVLNQLQFWMTAYSVREALPLTYLTLLGVVVIVGAYYVFSSLVFPDRPEEWPDLNAYYDQHNRFILTGMFVINILINVLAAPYRPATTDAQRIARDGMLGDLVVVAVFVGLALLLALIFVKGRRLNAALLATVIAMNLAAAVVVPVAGL